MVLNITLLLLLLLLKIPAVDVAMVTVAVDMAEVFVLSLLAFLSDVISLGRSLEIPRVDFGGDCRLLTPSC